MKIGVIGSGVSGLVSALTLQEKFEVSLFEKNSKLGGHSNTVTCLLYTSDAADEP